MTLNRRNLLLSAAGASAVTLLPGGAPAVAAPARTKLVTAHRGASGYLPEHTLAAYATAHAMGADYIEPDVVVTKDGALICLHDLWLETTTNAAARFSGRQRPDGHFYAADFTLAEIKSLEVYGRVKEAERKNLAGYQVATLEELILIVQELNRTTKRNCGLLVETKAPAFHLKEGKPLEAPVLAMLEKHGYRGPDALAPIQCFEADHLKRLREEHKSTLPLMLLTGKNMSEAEVDAAAAYVNGINPSRAAVEAAPGKPINDNAMLRAVKQRNLKMFVWTFNAEEEAIRRFLFDYGVDGVITNNPDVGVRSAIAK
jgi:glycerophosphoryl diester phosphodiesterase